MSTAGTRILRSARQALSYVEGETAEAFVVHKPLDVKAAREKLGMAEIEFAETFGFAIGTVRDWEQGRSQPDRPAEVLLRMIEQEPDAVRRVLDRL